MMKKKSFPHFGENVIVGPHSVAQQSLPLPHEPAFHLASVASGEQKPQSFFLHFTNGRTIVPAHDFNPF
jgi:hypothetical protein